MSTPTNPADRPDRDADERSHTGGVRGAINDLLGRDDPDDERRRNDPAPDDRGDRAGDPDTERGAPTGDRDDGRPADGRSDGVVGAAAPAGQQYGDQPTGGVPGSARHSDTGAGGPGYADPGQAQDPVRNQAQAQAEAQAQNPIQNQAPAQTQDPTRTPAPEQSQNPAPGQGPGQVQGRGQVQGPGQGEAGAPVDGGAARAGHDAAPADRGATGHDGAATTTRPADTDGPGAAAATTPSGSGAGSVANTAQGEDAQGREQLVSTDRATSYSSRWDAVKGGFVDEPRQAVAEADALVGELLDELQTLFTEQRRGIERGLDSDETSTEDMRLALRRYRSFFDRLLSI